MSQGRQKNQDCQNEFRQTSNGQMFFSKLFRHRKLSTIIKLVYETKSKFSTNTVKSKSLHTVT